MRPLFDGRKLSVSLTLQNPTDGLLIYTIGQAKMNGETLVAGSATASASWERSLRGFIERSSLDKTSLLKSFSVT